MDFTRFLAEKTSYFGAVPQLFPTVPRRITAVSHTAPDNFRYLAERVVPRLGSVQLVIKFEIINIDDRQSQGALLVGLEFPFRTSKKYFLFRSLVNSSVRAS